MAGNVGDYVAFSLCSGTTAMRTLRSILSRLGGRFRRAQRERDWSAEFDSHLEMPIEDNKRAGMSEQEARRQRRSRWCRASRSPTCGMLRNSRGRCWTGC